VNLVARALIFVISDIEFDWALEIPIDVVIAPITTTTCFSNGRSSLCEPIAGELRPMHLAAPSA
jgi:hypothetical protein